MKTVKTVLEPGMITYYHLDKSFFFNLGVISKYHYLVYITSSFDDNTYEVRNCWTDGCLVPGESVLVG